MLILLAHGSPRKEWRDSVEELAKSVRARSGAASVCLAYMDHGPPTLMDAANEAIGAGAAALRVLPLLLTAEGHVTHDIVPMVEELRAARPDVDIELLPAIGKHPMFADLLERIARQTDG